MTALGAILDAALPSAFGLALFALAAAFARMVRGPTLADRIVALDLGSMILVAFAGLVALESGSPVFLDVALVLALVSFLSTVAFARYVERRRPGDPDEEPAARADDDAPAGRG